MRKAMPQVLLLVLIVTSMIFAAVQPTLAKEIDLSFTPSGGYDRATWESGMYTNVTGKLHQDKIVFSTTAQIKYTGLRFTIVQPTLEVGWHKEDFNFSNWEQDAHVKKQSWDVLAGITVPIKKYHIYGLVGVSFVQIKASLYESLPNPIKDHGTTKMSENPVVIKVGAYRLWGVGPVKVGPEISVKGVIEETGFERCRKFKTNSIIPMLGIRIQW